MKIIMYVLVIGTIIVGGFFAFNNYIYEEKQSDVPTVNGQNNLQITPISHATMVLSLNGKTIYVDPVGGSEAFTGQAAPDYILLTDIHGDHLSTSTIAAIVTNDTQIVAPQAVRDILPDTLSEQVSIVSNSEVINTDFGSIQGVAMYNLPESDDAYHVKGRGNGYVLESGETRIYIAGDTSGTPEMRALQDIDVAFIPMNLPYTMSVEDAADAVLEFKPAKVYPYHYRSQEGFSDIELFKNLVNESNPDIEVILAEWYP